MPLHFQPDPGMLWMCDFDTGFVPPEMVKYRPVVVISPQPGWMTGLCTIVPLSTTPPIPVRPFHHLMDERSLPPGKLRENATWAKCDRLYTVSLGRLNRATRRRTTSAKFRVLDKDLNAIRACVVIALGLTARQVRVDDAK